MMAGDRRPARMLCLFTGVFANGGIQRFNRTLLTALNDLDVECDVLSMHDSPAPSVDEGWNPRMRIRGFEGSRWEFSKAALRALLRNGYDIVLVGHINFLVFTMAALMLRPWTRTRSYLVAHGIEVWYDLGPVRRWALARLSTILCVSRYTRQRILEQMTHLRDERIRVFPNCLGRSWKALAPAASPLPPDARYLLSVTRLERGDRYKGIATVIEALAQLEDTGVQYLVVGHGNDLEFLRLVARRYGVDQRVHFLRGISDAQLVNLYAHCDAFVLPSGKEGFGIVFLEAMFFGAPVIAAREKGALDVVRDGDTGLLVRFGDSIALREAIERLRGDAVLRERLKAHGRATVVEDGEFTYSRFAKRTAEVFALSGMAAT